MSNTNKAKAEQLGMPAGTATHRLRKQLLFKYVQLAGEDKCYACGLVIETVDDFTVEHKEPWFNRNAELFWDLDNIAFSHVKCNVPHSRPGVPGQTWRRKECPDGTYWCYRCKQYLQKDDFNKNRAKWREIEDECRLCKKERSSK